MDTQSEILSQPAVWRDVLEGLAALDSDQYPHPGSYDQVLFVGCGSTYYLSTWAARQCEAGLGVVARAAPSSDVVYFPSSWILPGRRTLLVAVSRSAETSETVQAVRRFQEEGRGDVVCITCNPDGTLAERCGSVVGVPAAQERSVVQTRSFTSMMLGALWLLNEGRVENSVSRLPGELDRVMATYASLASELGGDKGLDTLFFLGGGPLYGLACEAMLKMKETALTTSEAYHFLEIRHGPKSMVGEGSLVVGLISGQAEEQEGAVMREMQELGARTLAVGELAGSSVAEGADHTVSLESGLPLGWRSPLYLPVLQLMALKRSLAKGLDPDHPVNLDSVVVLDELD